MFTIQYETISGAHATQAFDGGNRRALVKHLSKFERPITAVYEQVTVITKVVRADMARLPLNTLSRAAKEFVADGHSFRPPASHSETIRRL